MAASFDALTITETTVPGIESELLVGFFRGRNLARTKANLRSRCLLTLQDFITDRAVSEGVFWDTLAALEDTAPTGDLYLGLQRLLSLELAVTYWFDQKDLPGRGETPTKRYESALKEVEREVGIFSGRVRLAYKNDELSFTQDRNAEEVEPTWAI